ncbi:MAG: hypothetical protein WCL06_05895, partial [Bacteroidota bacterium]
KQERFILPVVPMIITLGVVGWMEFYNKSKYWLRHKKLMKVLVIIFVTLNLGLLPFVTKHYSKKSRVESMYYLSKYHNLKCILLEDIYKDNPDMPPLFYLRQYPIVYNLSKNHPIDSLHHTADPFGTGILPEFVLFFDEENISQRVDTLKQFFPDLTYETTLTPSFIDDVLFHMNPANTNQTIVIYRNKKLVPIKID